MVNDDIGDYGRIIIKVFKGEMATKRGRENAPTESNQDDFFA